MNSLPDSVVRTRLLAFFLIGLICYCFDYLFAAAYDLTFINILQFFEFSSSRNKFAFFSFFMISTFSFFTVRSMVLT